MDPLELFNTIIEALADIGIDFGAGDESGDERLARLSAEISEGRDLADVLDSILFQDVFKQLGIAGPVGDEDPDTKDTEDAARIATELVEGREITDLIASLDRIVADQDLVGGGADTVIPGGGQLVRITDPTGTDAAVRYVVAYDINGILVTYDIGDVTDFLDFFPEGEAAFDEVTTLTQAQFDSGEFIEVGAIDEIIGQTESLTSTFERELTALGVEGLPDWLSGDTQALTLLATAADEDWSSTRLWNELSTTQGFIDRFTAFNDFAVAGETVEATINRLMAAEEQLAGALIQYRPDGFVITTDYLQDVLARGWDANEVAGVLEAEQIIRDNPESLSVFNSILLLREQDPLDEVGFLEAIAGSSEQDITETLNETAVALALANAGLADDVDLETIVEVIDNADALTTADDFTRVAQDLALEFARNRFELDTEKFGLTTDDLFATFFGEESPTGKSPGEILNTLAKFERERRAAAQGFGGAQAFVNQQGNLQLAGFSGL